MNFKEIYFLIWQRAWEFHKRYSSTCDWEKIITEGDLLVREMDDKPGGKLFRDLLAAVISELERNDKDGRSASLESVCQGNDQKEG